MRLPRPKFSLRSLVLATLLIASAALLYRDWEPWQLDYVVKGNHAHLEYVSFSPDESLLLAAEWGSENTTPVDNEFHVWDVVSGRELACISIGMGIPCQNNRIQFQSHGKLVGVSQYGLGAQLFESRTGEVLIKDATSNIANMEFSNDEHFVFVKFEDEKQDPEIWNAVSRTRVCALKQFPKDAKCLFKGIDATTAVFENYLEIPDAKPYDLWDTKTGTFSMKSECPNPFLNISPDRTRILVKNRCTLKTYPEGTEIQELYAPNDAVFSPDGRFVSTEIEKYVTLYDARTAKYVANFPNDGNWSFSPNGKWLGTCELIQKDAPQVWKTHIFNTDTFNEPALIPTQSGQSSIYFFKNGTRALIETYLDSMQSTLISLPDGVKLTAIQGFKSVSEDDQRILAVADEPRIYDAHTGLLLTKFQTKRKPLIDETVASSNLHYVAFPGENNTLQLWKRVRDEHDAPTELPVFWTTLLLVPALLWSLLKDLRASSRAKKLTNPISQG